MLGRLPISSQLRIATKYHPMLPGGPAQQLRESLENLQASKCDIFYLHMPATDIPLEETLKEVRAAHSRSPPRVPAQNTYPATAGCRTSFGLSV